jgi:hypothetical protein
MNDKLRMPMFRIKCPDSSLLPFTIPLSLFSFFVTLCTRFSSSEKNEGGNDDVRTTERRRRRKKKKRENQSKQT